jgi:pimeloyl-ACP methyl ester carboxylesterase
MPAATLHDGTTVELEVHGDGPALLLPVDPRPVEGQQAEELRRYGADPALGQSLIGGLRDRFRVVAFGYQEALFANPKPDTLTCGNAVDDLLAVADAAGAARFAYYGYSWTAMVGLQLALRTDRLSALVMGGFPPLDGPYAEMLRVTEAGNQLSRSESADDAEGEWTSTALSDAQSRQFVTLYRSLEGFDDRAAQARITCPRLCFVGSADEVDYPPQFGGVRVSFAGPVIAREPDLRALGWEVRVLDGLDHMQAMQASQVVPILRRFLSANLDAGGAAAEP